MELLSSEEVLSWVIVVIMFGISIPMLMALWFTLERPKESPLVNGLLSMCFAAVGTALYNLSNGGVPEFPLEPGDTIRTVVLVVCGACFLLFGTLTYKAYRFKNN